jgi:hypothetical protein
MWIYCGKFVDNYYMLILENNAERKWQAMKKEGGAYELCD